MQNVTISTDTSQEESVGQTTFLDPGPEEFFETLEQDIRIFARNLITRTIRDEFERFIGTESYERSEDRMDYRNGFRYRDFETRFGNMEDIPIPRTRNRCFHSRLFLRWRRRENKITRLLASLFIHGISTRKVKVLSKALWGKEYSASTVSRSNRILQEEYLKWITHTGDKCTVGLNGRFATCFWML